jgi:PPOX class probable F420-dependent enzyme
MRLTERDALSRLAAHDHGTLCTVHPTRGVDAVPIVYAVDEGGFLAVPIDNVKPKATGRLQRERNLDADPRATLLVDHWDREDWSGLWWVRAELCRLPGDDQRADAFIALLAERYPQYRGSETIVRLLLLQIVGVRGWAADPG